MEPFPGKAIPGRARAEALHGVRQAALPLPVTRCLAAGLALT